MISIQKGNLLDADAEALVNSVNCVGVMGRGVALQFKEAFPLNFKAYKRACDLKDVQPGRMFVYPTGSMTNPKFIINFPTKRHWRAKSRLEDIDTGLDALVKTVRELEIKSIAVPPLGAGLGGLNWSDVRPRIELAFEEMPTRVILFEPSKQYQAVSNSLDVPKMTPGRAALVVLMHQYLLGLLDPFVTLLEAHKLMYFMQESGQALNLRYSKAMYGPYAENLRHVLQSIEGHLIQGYANDGDTPSTQLAILPGAIVDAEAFLRDDKQTQERFQRVARLVSGFESSFGLELLATVHWVVTREGATSPEETVMKTYAWNSRKREFSPRQIGVAFETLKSLNWFVDFST